jgi:hypothetical protein
MQIVQDRKRPPQQIGWDRVCAPAILKWKWFDAMMVRISEPFPHQLVSSRGRQVMIFMLKQLHWQESGLIWIEEIIGLQLHSRQQAFKED